MILSICRVGPARAACAGPLFRLENEGWAGATRASLVPTYNRLQTLFVMVTFGVLTMLPYAKPSEIGLDAQRLQVAYDIVGEMDEWACSRSAGRSHRGRASRQTGGAAILRPSVARGRCATDSASCSRPPNGPAPRGDSSIFQMRSLRPSCNGGSGMPKASRPFPAVFGCREFQAASLLSHCQSNC